MLRTDLKGTNVTDAKTLPTFLCIALYRALFGILQKKYTRKETWKGTHFNLNTSELNIILKPQVYTLVYEVGIIMKGL